LQVVVLQALHEYRVFLDELYKWTYVPYWESRPALAEVEKRIRAARQTEGLPLAGTLLPVTEGVIFAQVRLDRRLAALRCVEALRLYAAAHDGRLPDTLAEVKDVPIPVDPATGNDLTYRRDGDRATLTGAAIPVPRRDNTLRYELTLTR
jgi:hypothetical protein